MSVKLNQEALSHANGLLRRGEITHDDRDDWSEHAPSTDENNTFIDKHGMAEYAKWHLGEDTDQTEGTRGRYLFLTATSRSSTGAPSSLVKAERANMTMPRSRRRSRSCLPRSTKRLPKSERRGAPG